MDQLLCTMGDTSKYHITDETDISAPVPKYITNFNPVNLLTTKLNWNNESQAIQTCDEEGICSKSTQRNSITWRDQMRDPIYKFVCLVAGLSRRTVFDFIQDDSKQDGKIQREVVVRTLERTLNELHKSESKARRYASLRVLEKADGAAILVTDFSTLCDRVNEGQIKMLSSIYVADDGERAKINTWIQQNQQKLLSIEQDISNVHQKLDEVNSLGTNSPWDDVKVWDTAKDPLMNLVDEHSRKKGVFFSNELYFKPEFQGAIMVALEKIKSRCGEMETFEGKPLLNQLMVNPKLKTCFARVVAMNVLIIHENNSRGEWKGIINYRRIVNQENIAIMRLKRLLGVKTRTFCDFGSRSVMDTL